MDESGGAHEADFDGAGALTVSPPDRGRVKPARHQERDGRPMVFQDARAGYKTVSASVSTGRPSGACCTVSEGHAGPPLRSQRIAARLIASQLNATTPGSKVRGQSLADPWTEAYASVGMARPSSYSPAILPVVRACATFGATAEEIANYLDVPWGSFKRWIYAEPELREALKRGRDASDGKGHRKPLSTGSRW